MNRQIEMTSELESAVALPVPSESERLAQTGKQNMLATVARNSAFVLGVQVVIKLLAFLFNVFIVRRLGDVHFGQYSTVMAYVTMFAIFTDWGLSPYSVREMAKNPQGTSWMLPGIVVIRIVLSLVVIIIAPLSALWLGKDSDIVRGIWIASMGLLLYAFQGPLEGALTARERLDYTSAYALVTQLVFWGMGTLLLLNGMGFIGLLVASLTGVAVAAVLSGWTLSRLHVGRLDFAVQRWPKLFTAALPFGISGISYVFMDRFDTVLMSFVLTAAAVGWYNVPWTLINMILLVAQSIATAMYPSMVKSYNHDPKSLPEVVWQSTKYLLIACLPISVGGTVLANRIINVLYGQTFAGSIPVLQVILWALPSLFLLELLGRVADTMHLERRAAKINVINAAITVVLDLILVPTLGILGAALALVGGRTIRLAQFWRLVGSNLVMRRRWSTVARGVLAAFVMGVLVWAAGELAILGSNESKVALLALIAIGALAYGAALLLLGVIDRQDLGFLFRTLTRAKG
jgi:O-antigen/teichoic acid export membrane protein